MKKIHLLLLTTALSSASVFAHCQIPCGIYDDPARITEMEEHVTTIEKSMNEIIRLKPDTPEHSNQLVRWVMNKEDHADQLSEIVTYYFLAQRIKSSTPEETYVKQLKVLHGMMVASMKAKQTVDLEQVKTLRTLIHEFEHLYFGDSATAPHTH